MTINLNLGKFTSADQKFSGNTGNTFFFTLAVIATVLAGGMSALQAQDAPPLYNNASLAVDTRVADLVARVTLEEKARQLDMYFGCEDLLDKNMNQSGDHHTQAKPDAIFDPGFAEKILGNPGVGSIHSLYPRAKLSNHIQEWVNKSNRPGIPPLVIEEGLHGYMDYDETVFPQGINLATTWNPELARQTGAAIAAQARANGVAMILGPVLDVQVQLFLQRPVWLAAGECFRIKSYML